MLTLEAGCLHSARGAAQLTSRKRDLTLGPGDDGEDPREGLRALPRRRPSARARQVVRGDVAYRIWIEREPTFSTLRAALLASGDDVRMTSAPAPRPCPCRRFRSLSERARLTWHQVVI